MSEKIITVFSNSNFESRRTTKYLIGRLREFGYSPVTTFHKDAELIITVGGDGAFIKTVNRTNFSDIPMIGINTGHLGFYQEVSPREIDSFLQSYHRGEYEVEKLHLIGAEIFTRNRNFFMHAVNEVVLKSQSSKVIHMNVFVDRNHLEKFSGDGMLVTTPTGSTGYNMSLKGPVIFPTIPAYALTPMAPISSHSYRSLASSIVIPGDHVVSLVPEKRYASSNVILIDGMEHNFTGLKKVNLRIADKSVNKLVVSKQNYWDNVKSRFL
ncbi:MAG: NAD(+)/NADH kinase [Tissierellia bacterium]|nr:NAD(+)/NADH kinase [Tissierellia bacterium]